MSPRSDVHLGGLLHGYDGTSFFYNPMRNIETDDGFGDYQTIGP